MARNGTKQTGFLLRWIAPRFIRIPYHAGSMFHQAHRASGSHCHGLRHTFISLMISKGIDIVTVSTLVGHSMPSTTIYMFCACGQWAQWVCAEYQAARRFGANCLDGATCIWLSADEYRFREWKEIIKHNTPFKRSKAAVFAAIGILRRAVDSKQVFIDDSGAKSRFSTFCMQRLWPLHGTESRDLVWWRHKMCLHHAGCQRHPT